MNYEEYKVLAAGQKKLDEEFGDIAYKIAEKLTGGRCNRITSFGEDRVYYEYNGSCGCHPSNDTDDFDSEWLFDPLWEEKWEAIKANSKKVQEELARGDAEKEKKRREAEERKTFESLKAKYEG